VRPFGCKLFPWVGRSSSRRPYKVADMAHWASTTLLIATLGCYVRSFAPFQLHGRRAWHALSRSGLLMHLITIISLLFIATGAPIILISHLLLLLSDRHCARKLVCSWRWCSQDLQDLPVHFCSRRVGYRFYYEVLVFVMVRQIRACF